ncbi:helix-turn-helix domain-containing protein [Paenibacillus sp. NEAU-GSW1]|uniref:helix-turn-helix domain-containing protein n=1 Tax=Paenibacillus sp. NEAU-GSW1 TaxID=2682486 RepID=UPI0020A6ABF9|nr:helix-turn-helix transcriptional regulator [Paenibacillus sp. NEAU-GSW1]
MIMAFKDRLKSLRNERGLTQEDLAKKLDLPASTIRRYETTEGGFPKQERLQLIADFFNCSVDYLLERNEDRYSTEEVTKDDLDDEDRFLLDKFMKLKEEDQKYILELMDRLNKE